MYIIFAYDHYYPSGGAGDIEGQSKNYDKAVKKAEKVRNYFGQPRDMTEIYCTREKRVVWAKRGL